MSKSSCRPVFWPRSPCIRCKHDGEQIYRPGHRIPGPHAIRQWPKRSRRRRQGDATWGFMGRFPRTPFSHPATQETHVGELWTTSIPHLSTLVLQKSTSSFQAIWFQMNQTWNCQEIFGILVHLDTISYANHGETAAVTPQTVPFPSHMGGRHRFLSIATICQSEACDTMSYNHPPNPALPTSTPAVTLQRCWWVQRVGLFTIFAGKNPFEGPLVQSANFPPNLWILQRATKNHHGKIWEDLINCNFWKQVQNIKDQKSTVPSFCRVYFLSTLQRQRHRVVECIFFFKEAVPTHILNILQLLIHDFHWFHCFHHLGLSFSKRLCHTQQRRHKHGFKAMVIHLPRRGKTVEGFNICGKQRHWPCIRGWNRTSPHKPITAT